MSEAKKSKSEFTNLALSDYITSKMTPLPRRISFARGTLQKFRAYWKTYSPPTAPPGRLVGIS
jgi:hypothetical protein